MSPADQWSIGERVHVVAYGAWREGVVVHTARKRVTVRVTRNGTGAKADVSIPAEKVHTAHRVEILPAWQVSTGHRAALSDEHGTGWFTIRDGRRAADGRWTLLDEHGKEWTLKANTPTRVVFAPVLALRKRP